MSVLALCLLKTLGGTASIDVLVPNGHTVPTCDDRWVWRIWELKLARENEVLGDMPAPVPLGHRHVPHGLQWDWIWASEIRIQEVTAWSWWSIFILPASQIQNLWLFPGQFFIFLVFSHLVFFCSGENHVSYFLCIESQCSKKLEWTDPSNCAPLWLNDFTDFNFDIAARLLLILSLISGSWFPSSVILTPN